jgi:hypothetical protein
MQWYCWYYPGLRGTSSELCRLLAFASIENKAIGVQQEV